MILLSPSVSSLTNAVLLVALGLGYVVCYLAEREEKFLRTLGYFIGTFMVALSMMIIITNILLFSRVQYRGEFEYGGKPAMMRSPGQTMTQQQQHPAAPANIPAKPCRK